MKLYPTTCLIVVLGSLALAQTSEEGEPHSTPGAQIGRVMAQASSGLKNTASLAPGREVIPVPNPLDQNAPPIGYRVRTVGATGTVVEKWYRDEQLTEPVGVTFQATPAPGGVDVQMFVLDDVVNWKLRDNSGVLTFTGTSTAFGVKTEILGKTEPGQNGERTMRNHRERRRTGSRHHL